MHEGRRYFLKKKVVQCLLCNDVVTAEEIGTTKCKCGEMTIQMKYDQYCRGNVSKMRDMSVWVAEGIPRAYLPQQVIDMIWREIVKNMKCPSLSDLYHQKIPT